jgi:hypothetical protein
MELSTTREITSCAASLWCPSIFWNQKVCYCIHRSRQGYMIFRNKLVFSRQGVVRPVTILMVEDHPLSFFRGCLFSIFAATLKLPQDTDHTHKGNKPGYPMLRPRFKSGTLCVQIEFEMQILIILTLQIPEIIIGNTYFKLAKVM